MKTVYRLGSLIVAAAVIFGAGRLWAENQKKKPPLRTRIGLVNLTYVIKNYDKYKQFQEEVKEIAEPFQKRDQKLHAQFDKLKEKLQQSKADSSLVPAQADDLEEKLTMLKRDLEDNQAKAKKKLGKRSDDKMKIIFMDVTEMAQRCAQEHDLDLVMHYNDAVTEADYLSTKNIARKLNTGALMPLYWKPHMDLSMEVKNLLNRKKRKD